MNMKISMIISLTEESSLMKSNPEPDTSLLVM